MTESTWDRVTSLKAVITDSGQQDCQIYANGLNRISVTVFIECRDTDDKVMEVPLDHLADKTQFIQYTSKEKLTWNGSSGWCYTHQKNQFTAIPDLGSGKKPDGVGQQITFYVYCSSDTATSINIGVHVATDTGKDFWLSYDSESFHTPVNFQPKAPFAYGIDDVDWRHEKASYWLPDVYKENEWKFNPVNYYLSCKRPRFKFVTFDAHSYQSAAPRYNKMCVYQLTSQGPDYSHWYAWFHGAYVWDDEPHEKAQMIAGASNAFFNLGDSLVTVYDSGASDKNWSLCFTWVESGNSKEGSYCFDSVEEGFSGARLDWGTYVIVYDQYGNSGRFDLDTSDILNSLGIKA
ncbi:hypothetical protein [Kitasatospora sp. NPDC056731]|uniref:hypothetical protein n=1 Tax=Kitasatospora sp. NPDC056731 TaxID=3155422 RepID=UPI00343FC36E